MEKSSEVGLPLVRCPTHDELCLIKTGCKEGPNQGKSFHVCAQCSFLQKVRSLKSEHCQVHDAMVELQQYLVAEDGEIRKRYRCLEGKSSKTWCKSNIAVSGATMEMEAVVTRTSGTDERVSNTAGCKGSTGPETKSNGSSKMKRDSHSTSTMKTTRDSNSKSGADIDLKSKNNSKLKHGSRSASALTSCSDTSSSSGFEGIGDKSSSQSNMSSNSKPKHSSIKYRSPGNDGDLAELENQLGSLSVATKRDPHESHRMKGTALANIEENQSKSGKSSGKLSTAKHGLKSRSDSHLLTRAQTKEEREPLNKIKSDEISSLEAGISGLCVGSRDREPKEAAKIRADISQKESILKLVHLSVLPDGGKKLHSQISALKERLKECLERGVVPSESEEDEKVESYQRTDREGSVKFLSEVPQLPDHVFRAMYNSGDRSSFRTWWRARDRESIHKDVISGLHRQLEAYPNLAEEASRTADPPGLAVDLLPHQKEALCWLKWREGRKPSGGILADDMGLGKTVSMIALLLASKESAISAGTGDVWSPTLIVCPVGVLRQWELEIQRRCTDGILTCVAYHGAKRATDPSELGRADVVLTTYGTVRQEQGDDSMDNTRQLGQQQPREDNSDTYSPRQEPTDALLDQFGSLSVGSKSQNKPKTAARRSINEADTRDGYRSTNSCGLSSEDDLTPSKPAKRRNVLFQVVWSRVILDEAHAIKNPRVKESGLVSCLKARCRWAVTGTPIHNSSQDVYSLLRFLKCQPFDEEKKWKEWIVKDRNGKERLCVVIGTLLLRRMKTDTIEGKPLVTLPGKKVIVHKVVLDGAQRKLYDLFDQQAKEAVKKIKERRYRDSKEGSEQERVLTLVLRLRQCCTDARLVKMKNIEKADEDNFSEPSDRCIPIEQSCKITKLLQLLDETKKDKSLIVSQWVGMLDILKAELVRSAHFVCAKDGRASPTRRQYFYVHGSLTPAQRQEEVERFGRAAPGSVLLLSLLAGGEGMNLTAANQLFMVDMHWNPAKEEQAFDRVYRIGQTKPVTIHKFVCSNTIEEHMVAVQDAKRRAAKDVLVAGKADKRSDRPSFEDLQRLFQ